MRLKFTKMQGAGNDFVVLDGTRAPLRLSTAQLQHLGDRRFGVGADQILLVERADTPGVDFRYRIFNGASGAEVEHCGNGARCFVRYVRDKGLTDAHQVRVQTVNRVLALTEQADGRVTVDMGPPEFEPGPMFQTLDLGDHRVQVMLLSMGNPHAVQRVDDVDSAPVLQDGPLIECHARFPQGVNAGFLQVLSRTQVKLRVFERDAGETLACGTGACAAVVAGIRAGWLDARVDVALLGGNLQIEWTGGHVFMTGPAETVFEGEIEL